MTTEIALSVENLTVKFGGVTACDSIGFDVKRGELFAVIGPNGAGKTTLINALTGIYEPVKGASAKFHHTNGTTYDLLSYARPHEIARLGMARTFQNLGVFNEQTVLSNLMLGRYNHETPGIFSCGFFSSKAINSELKSREAVESILSLFELEDYRNELVGGLPYGVQKRVELGRVLAMEPELLLLDEPMAGMTAEEKQDMVRFVYRLMEQTGVTILLIEHDMGVVMAISERVLALEFGRSIALGTPGEVQSDPEVIRAYLGTETH